MKRMSEYHLLIRRLDRCIYLSYSSQAGTIGNASKKIKPGPGHPSGLRGAYQPSPSASTRSNSCLIPSTHYRPSIPSLTCKTYPQPTPIFKPKSAPTSDIEYFTSDEEDKIQDGGYVSSGTDDADPGISGDRQTLTVWIHTTTSFPLAVDAHASTGKGDRKG